MFSSLNGAQHVLIAAISFGIDHKELKIAQTAQIIIALSTFETNLYIRCQLVWVNSYIIEQKRKQWRQQ